MRKKLLFAFVMLLSVQFATDTMAQDVMNIKMKSINGGKKKLKQYKGKVVYVDFWAAWCGPCHSAMPSLTSLQQEFGDDLQIVTISLDDNKKAWKKKYKELNPAGSGLWVGKSGMHSKMAKEMVVFALPQYAIIDRNGRVIDSPADSPINAREAIRRAIGS